MEFRKVGVLGAGNIGVGVVTDLVLHGISAVVVDVSEEILQRAQADVLKNIRVVPLLSKTLPRITKEEAVTRMVLTTDLRDLAPCDFVIENVTENWEIKKQVYEESGAGDAPRSLFWGEHVMISITQIGECNEAPPRMSLASTS